MTYSSPRFAHVKTDIPFHHPRKGTAFSAGYDLFAPLSFSIGVAPNNRVLIDTGIGCICPPHHFGYIMSRSSLAKNHAVQVMGGVIDEDYRGTLGVILINHSSKAVVIERGIAMAQIAFIKICSKEAVIISGTEFKESTTVRGQGGYGSTDKNKRRRIHIDESKNTEQDAKCPEHVIDIIDIDEPIQARPSPFFGNFGSFNNLPPSGLIGVGNASLNEPVLRRHSVEEVARFNFNNPNQQVREGFDHLNEKDREDFDAVF